MSPRSVHRAAAAGAAAAGLLVALGAALPWITLYGGLHPLRGIVGPYGQALFAAGIGSALGAALLMLRSPRAAGRLLLALAGVILAFASWLGFSRLPATVAALQENPLLVAGTGPGIYLVIAGAGAMLAAAAVAARTVPAPISASNAMSPARIRS